MISIALSLPVVQTKLAHIVTEKINKDFGTDININQVNITLFGGIKLKKVMIKDHHKDTLIYANRINTTILDFKNFIDGRLLFGDVRIDGLFFNLKNYKNEQKTNLDLFVEAFDDGKPSSGKFLLTSSNVYLTNGHFLLSDENNEQPVDINFNKINFYLKNFKIKGPDVSALIEKMSFYDHRGIFIENLKSDFLYTEKNIKLKKLDLATKESMIKGDIVLSYKNDDFKDFNNKVLFNISLENSRIATNDIRYFYKELGKDQVFVLKSKIKGTLNNLYATKLFLVDNKYTVIKGDVNFRNLFPKSPGSFYMDGDFDKISSNYQNLIRILPNILGKNLPSNLDKLGQFSFFGKTKVTQNKVVADFIMNTALGVVESDLTISNIENIDNAFYSGNVILDNFDVGYFLKRKEIGKVSLNVDVNGKGFTQKFLNTTVSGNIDKVYFNGYNYSGIIVDGSFKEPIFKGELIVNDPNLFMDFNGLIDLSKKVNTYDFHSKIDFANLKKLNFIKDSISVFKGDIVIKAEGNSIDNMVGDIKLTQSSYQNKKDLYFFDYININSSFDEDQVRTISINSPDVIQGKVIGKFRFDELQKIVENSFGSLYANYNPNKVTQGQYLKFNFEVYSKIIEIFFPEVSLSANTILKGNISTKTDEFKLDFNSPKITAYDNTFDNIMIKLDNKNPLYNAFVQMDTINTKYYKVRDFSLINSTANDTLNFRTEFRGGNKGEDFYNINLYHTINEDNKNVVGFNKSELQFKDYLWYLNEKHDDKNKIVFDKKMKNFSFENFVLSHKDEKITLHGSNNDKYHKNLQLSFLDVDLNKITPELEEFSLDGKLNGEINLIQTNNIYQPTSSLNIEDLMVNKIPLGKLNLDIKGDDSLKKFYLSSVIENQNAESLSANGELEIVNDETMLDLDLYLDKFNLGILGKIGGEVITNIRGFATGSARIDGNVKNLDYNGRFFINDAGLTIPYIKTDYQFENNAVIDITENKFIIRETVITDTKYNTKGKVVGYIKHKQFEDWQLDLSIDSDRLLALDTKDHEDAAYFGIAFIRGSAVIKGPTNGLVIKVKASSEKGTDIKIPINDSEAISDNNYIHFLSTKDKQNIGKKLREHKRNYEGLELDFEFDIKDNATIEVILNRDTGHGMKGRGFGTLLFKINTLGKFNMWGDFQAYEGTYNFKYGGIIDKKFEVKKGGSINWTGDPMAAVLNLEAVYKTTANPAVLIDNPSFNKKVDVDVVIGIKGNLNTPEPEFNINFPNVSSVLKSEIQYKLDDKDVRQTQALYLLSSGGFLSQEGINQNQFSNNLFERASSLFNDIFRDEEGKLNLGVDYVTADRTPGLESQGRFGVTVSSRINERITINGKVGVPVGGINESAIVGDVEVQYRVNEDGTLNLRVFNRQNDINYIGLGQGIGYTQGLGISYEVDFSTFKELVNKIFKNAKINKISTTVNEMHDSTELPDYMHMINETEKEKKKENTKINKEAIPSED